MVNPDKLEDQIQATGALLRFCRETGYFDAENFHIKEIELSLRFLEAGDLDQAIPIYLRVARGGKDTFGDAWPQRELSEDDWRYTITVFHALVCWWKIRMDQQLPEERRKRAVSELPGTLVLFGTVTIPLLVLWVLFTWNVGQMVMLIVRDCLRFLGG